jgi:endonuclease YncB( thermonuclease family)
MKSFKTNTYPHTRTIRGGAYLALALLSAMLITSGCKAFEQTQSSSDQESTGGEQSRIEGRVVRIIDGDTVEVLDAGNRTTRVRLSGIDAPERKQAFGTRAREELSKLVYNQRVSVLWTKHDRYERVLGKLLDARGTDVALEMISRGMAWLYTHYEQDLADEDRRAYREAEGRARSERTGLWADDNPTPPWDFRRQ